MDIFNNKELVDVKLNITTDILNDLTDISVKHGIALKTLKKNINFLCKIQIGLIITNIILIILFICEKR